MPNTREKLIELISESRVTDTADSVCINGSEYIADHLIANGVTVQKWIPVTERLPNDNERVLVCYINPLRKDRPPRMMVGEGTSTQIVKGKVYLWCGGWRSITHWMPLPEPPKGE